MYINSKLVPRADRISDSVLQTGHPFLLFPLTLVYICRKQFCFRTIQRLAKRKTVPKQIRFSTLIFNRISKCPSAAAEIEVKSVLFAFCFTSAPLNAGTPPRGTFTGAADRRLQVWSAVRTNQPPVSDELTLLCQLILKRFFFCTVSGTEGELPKRGKRSPSGGFSFWQGKKKMWGTFHAAKPRFSQQLLYFTKSKYPVPYLPRNINNF